MNVQWNEQGLIPAVAQDAATGEVLMLAWVNAEALQETLETGHACYYSRSRGKLWRKGESSGQQQRIKSVQLDCDRDAVLYLVEQQGVACHTGRRGCFYTQLSADGEQTMTPVQIDPKELYGA